MIGNSILSDISGYENFETNELLLMLFVQFVDSNSIHRKSQIAAKTKSLDSALFCFVSRKIISSSLTLDFFSSMMLVLIALKILISLL